MMNHLILLSFSLFFLSAASAQVYLTRETPDGAVSIEVNRNYRCNTLADARGCERDPNFCRGQDFCSSSDSGAITRWWYTAGTFTSRGAGNNCAEAKRRAIENLYRHEDNLCGANGRPSCRGGDDGGNCYFNGRQIVAWFVCHNDFGAAPGNGNPAVGFFLIQMLRRK